MVLIMITNMVVVVVLVEVVNHFVVSGTSEKLLKMEIS